MQLTGKSIIGYSQGAGGDKTYHGLHAVTGGQLEPAYTSASAAEVNKAAELAGRAFETYRRKSGKQRAAFLRAIADKIEARTDAIVARCTAETALPEGRVRGETARTTGQLRLFAETIEEGSWLMARIDRANLDRKPLPKPDVRSLHRPLGPVVVFCASNFPLAFSVAGGDTAAALAAGCPVVVMAHRGHPGTAEIVGQALVEAAKETGQPEGIFSLLYSVGHGNGEAIVQHPAIKAAGFTGSRGGGRRLFDLSCRRPEPIPFYAEMSSINPVFILPGALKSRGEEIAKGLSASITLGVGQFCTCPGLAIVAEGSDGKAFATKLGEFQNAVAPMTMLNHWIQDSYKKGVGALSSQEGVTAVALQDPPGERQVCAALFETDAKHYLAHPELADEVFGPSSTVVRHGNREEMLALARGLEGQLTATVHGDPRDLLDNAELIAILETKAGRLIFNGFPTGVEVCHAMVHGGPYPATADGRSTSVGTQSIYRFTRAVCFQNWPDAARPDELKNSNPLGIFRLVDGKVTDAKL
jgi:NADP-dependent aldehyde dehydrogenase